MRISFYSAAAVAVAAGLFEVPVVEAVKLEADNTVDAWQQDYEPLVLAQTGVEAEA